MFVRVSAREMVPIVMLLTGLVGTLGIYGGIIRTGGVREPRACIGNVRGSLLTSLLLVIADKEDEVPSEAP